MSYNIYTTDAIVCGTYDRNTSDRSYRLFTQKLGMVWADARSVRAEKSKQRSALTDFSLVRISLVRGKAGWKIGSVVAQTNFYHAATDQAARGSVVSIVRLVRRYLQGEETNVELFDFVTEALKTAGGSIEHRAFFDGCVAARCLTLLGYVATDRLPDDVSSRPAAEFPALFSVKVERKVKDVLRIAEAASQL